MSDVLFFALNLLNYLALLYWTLFWTLRFSYLGNWITTLVFCVFLIHNTQSAHMHIRRPVFLFRKILLLNSFNNTFWDLGFLLENQIHQSMFIFTVWVRTSHLSVIPPSPRPYPRPGFLPDLVPADRVYSLMTASTHPNPSQGRCYCVDLLPSLECTSISPSPQTPPTLSAIIPSPSILHLWPAANKGCQAAWADLCQPQYEYRMGWYCWDTCFGVGVISDILRGKGGTGSRTCREYQWSVVGGPDDRTHILAADTRNTK